jgi:hypothetical protein
MTKMYCEPGKWIPCALEHHKEGSLHRMLHVPPSEPIPPELLQKAKKAKLGTDMFYNGYRIPVTKLFKARVRLAKTLKGFHK